MFRRLPRTGPRASLARQFGVRSGAQLARDVGTVLSHLPSGDRFAASLSTAGLLRPDLSLPAYAGLLPTDGLAPIFNLFDRVGGGRGFKQSATRDRCLDHRGGRLTYDEHDGTDFVCAPGTELACAAPGVLTAVRDDFLRGGLTACVDHGHGVVTQYTHLSEVRASIGEALERGSVVALSGSAGFDMITGFPWVPPHVHFMVWVRGRPVDPYLASGEPERAGIWLHGGEPRPSGPLDGDEGPRSLASVGVDRDAVDRAIARCLVPRIRDELERAPSPASAVAVLEDSLHHEPWAWPAGLDVDALRPPADATRVKLTLPLPASLYRGARAADSPWTRAFPWRSIAGAGT